MAVALRLAVALFFCKSGPGGALKVARWQAICKPPEPLVGWIQSALQACDARRLAAAANNNNNDDDDTSPLARGPTNGLHLCCGLTQSDSELPTGPQLVRHRSIRCYLSSRWSTSDVPSVKRLLASSRAAVCDASPSPQVSTALKNTPNTKASGAQTQTVSQLS